MIHPLDRDELRSQVQACIEGELARQRRILDEVGPDLAALVDPVQRLLSGGKRLRAAFAYWGYRAAGRPGSPHLVRLASAMEFFQAAALLHDDVMDGSDTRRGMPSAHRAAALAHTESGWSGDSDRFGEATAILAGDLCLQWTDELYATSGLPAEHLARGRETFDRMRTQLMGGQFLDVLESVRGWEGMTTADRVAAARRVIRFKSAKYTIEAPLLIGALAGGMAADSAAALSAYGLTLGEAFQLRDDLLGVFGDPVHTGKPAGDDLREGKRTVLVAYAADGSAEPERDLLLSALGDPGLTPQVVADVRILIDRSGAVERVEADIATLAAQARAALASIRAGVDPTAYEVLDALIAVTTDRVT